MKSESPLSVLITNRTLATRTGTEIYVRDLALGLHAKGHVPIVYSPHLGNTASEIRASTIPVVDHLAQVGSAPDVIHGHHGLETLAALLAFPGVPALAFCHSWTAWFDLPAKFPRIRRYVAVDETCKHRLQFEHGIAEDQIHVVLNFVDLNRFQPRSPLPRRPVRALVFSNAAGGKESHLTAVKEACERSGIAVDVAGFASRNPLNEPELVLGRYDLIFAKARSAIEAMAVGAAVILCDAVGAGPLVTTKNLRQLRPLNFGMRALQQPVTVEWLVQQISLYDCDDAAKVCQEIRKHAGLDAAVQELTDLYRCVIAEQSSTTADLLAESRAAADYLQTLAPRLHEGDLLKVGLARLLRVPVLGHAIRMRARKEPDNHWLRMLLKADF